MVGPDTILTLFEDIFHFNFFPRRAVMLFEEFSL